jgi:hypothetical protein
MHGGQTHLNSLKNEVESKDPLRQNLQGTFLPIIHLWVELDEAAISTKAINLEHINPLVAFIAA